MRIVIDLPEPLVQRASEAVESALYPSVDALAAVAIGRLLGTGVTVSARAPVNLTSASESKSRSAIDGPTQGSVGAYVFNPENDAQWLWGMINRVFPLKLAVRTCADLAQQGPVWLHSLHGEFARRGRDIGSVLASSDRRNGRLRNEATAVGFPLGDDEQKAAVRFAHQFIGRRTALGTYLGGAFETGLIGPIERGTDLVAPTEMGWEFAKIYNGILDEGRFERSNLEQKEREYYLLQVAARVPAERNAFRSILDGVRTRPLDAKSLAVRLRPLQAGIGPDAVKATSRSGALARLTELGAIVRSAAGRSASYEITPSGIRAHEELESGSRRTLEERS